MSKYGHRSHNWFEAIVNKIGGEAAADSFLRNELVVRADSDMIVRRVTVDRGRTPQQALDTTGSVLTATRARVRPKTLGPGSRGSFTVRLEALDPNSVLRTRASVVEWETEVLDAG